MLDDVPSYPEMDLAVKWKKRGTFLKHKSHFNKTIVSFARCNAITIHGDLARQTEQMTAHLTDVCSFNNMSTNAGLFKMRAFTKQILP